MPWLVADLPTYLASYGYMAVALLIVLEGVGLPIPGATILIAASVYAGVTADISILGVIAAATLGAVVGDNLCYWLGRVAGEGLIRRSHQRWVSDEKIKRGQHLYSRFGDRAVFFGRFIPVLRVLTTALAGLNRMPWPRFFIIDVAGGTAWATVFGLAAYSLGEQAHQLSGLFGMSLLVLGCLAVAGAMLLRKRHKAGLELRLSQH